MAPNRRTLLRLHLLLTTAVAVASLLNLLLAERIPLSEGLGWDGVVFGAVARDFYASVFVEGVDPYMVQRVLPSAIVHGLLRIAGAPLDNPHVILGFQYYHLMLFVLCAVLWKPIADELQIGRAHV